MGTELDAVIEKALKIKALADDTANEHEKDAAYGILSRLLLKYQMEMDDLERIAGDREDAALRGTENVCKAFFTFRNVAPLWRQNLIHALARGLGCRSVRSTKRSRVAHVDPTTFDYVVIVLGIESDVRMVEALYGRLANDLLLSAALDYTEHKLMGEHTGTKRQWENSYMTAAGAEIEKRLKAGRVTASAEMQAETGRNITALVSVRDTKVAQAFRAEFPRLNRGRAQTIYTYGKGAGTNAGRSANLSAGSLGQGTKGYLK